MNLNGKNIVAAGCLVITKDRQILAFARRGNINKLGLPAGKIEGDEDLRTAAAREVFEETGLVVEIKDSDRIFIYIPDDKKLQGKEEYCATFVLNLEESSEEIDLKPEVKLHSTSRALIVSGFGLWVTPEKFIDSANSAFLEYNTELLKFAETELNDGN